MNTRASLGLVLLASVLAAAGCSTTSRALPPGKDVVRQIGLPMYPRGVTLLRAQEVTMGSKFGATTVISQSFETTDDFDTVKQFYERALPTSKREVALPLGSVKEVTLQFVVGSYQKEVIVMNIPRTGTVVVLQSTNLNLAAPAPTFSSNPGSSADPTSKKTRVDRTRPSGTTAPPGG